MSADPIHIEGFDEKGQPTGAGRKPGAKTLESRQRVIEFVNSQDKEAWFNTNEVVNETELERREAVRALIWLVDFGVLERKTTVKLNKETGRPVVVWGRVED